jgi:hypothetical protein
MNIRALLRLGASAHGKELAMLDVIYVGVVVLFFAGFALYALGCEKL